MTIFIHFEYFSTITKSIDQTENFSPPNQQQSQNYQSYIPVSNTYETIGNFDNNQQSQSRGQNQNQFTSNNVQFIELVQPQVAQPQRRPQATVVSVQKHSQNVLISKPSIQQAQVGPQQNQRQNVQSRPSVQQPQPQQSSAPATQGSEVSIIEILR